MLVPLQAQSKVAPLHRKLHVLAVASLIVTLAFLILLSVSNIHPSGGSSLGFGRAGFLGGIAPVKLIDGKSGETVAEDLRGINYGLWNYCWVNYQRPYVGCSTSGLGYSHTIISTADDAAIIFPSTWTRALVLHPIAAVTAFIALISTHSMRVAFKGHSVVLSTVSLAMVLATLAVDIAFGVITGRNIQGNALFNAFFIFDLGFWLMIVPTFFSIVAWTATVIGHWKKPYVKVVYYAEPNFPISSTLTQANFDNGPWWKRFKWAGANTASTTHSETSTVVEAEQPTKRSV